MIEAIFKASPIFPPGESRLTQISDFPVLAAKSL
jgi:hypothetical protein